jgi:sigma-E factor negative regulatory protein RseA
MSEEDFKSLSLLMDGELPSEESARLIRELVKDERLKSEWTRQHRVRDALQGQLNSALDGGFAARVSAAVDAEPTIIAPQPLDAVSREADVPAEVVAIPVGRAKRSYNRPLAGLAIAASVAAVSLLALQVLDGGQGGGLLPASPQLASGTPLIAVPAGAGAQLVSSSGTHWSMPAEAERDAELEQRLNMYLSDHMEQAPINGVQGVLPYSRLVGYDTAK